MNLKDIIITKKISIKLKIITSFLMLGFILFACSNPEKSNHGSITLAKSTETTATNISKNNLLIVKGDSLHVTINGGFITVPKKSIYDYDSVYSGIYNVKNDSVTQQFSVKLGNIVYFTTFASVGMGYRGYLYAYDAERKKLLENYKSNENYVYASGGIFFLNKKCIFCVQAPAHENAEDPFYTLVDMYCIKTINFATGGLFVQTVI